MLMLIKVEDLSLDVTPLDTLDKSKFKLSLMLNLTLKPNLWLLLLNKLFLLPLKLINLLSNFITVVSLLLNVVTNLIMVSLLLVMVLKMDKTIG